MTGPVVPGVTEIYEESVVKYKCSFEYTCVRMNAFLNIDPYINLERQEAIDMIKTSLLINTPLIVQQKQNTLKLQ